MKVLLFLFALVVVSGGELKGPHVCQKITEVTEEINIFETKYFSDFSIKCFKNRQDFDKPVNKTQIKTTKRIIKKCCGMCVFISKFCRIKLTIF